MSDYYYFYDSSRPDTIGPLRCIRWSELLGGPPYYYTREQIENFANRQGVLAETKRNRLLALKKGSNLKMSRLHSCGDLMIHRCTDEEVTIYESLSTYESECHELRKEIYDKTKDLQKKLSEIVKKRDALKKKEFKLKMKLLKK